MSRGDADPARLSEEQALRRSFDVRNRRVLPWVLWPMGVFFFGATIASLGTGSSGWPIGLLGFALTAGMALLLRFVLPLSPRGAAGLSPLGRALAARFGELVPLELMLVFLLGSAWATFSDESPPFLFLSAVALVAFRLSLVSRLAVHATVLVGGIAMLWVAGMESLLEVAIGSILLHVASAVLGWFFTRRLRRRFLAEWRRVTADARERLRLREELALAREVQLSMLPESVPELPWMDVAAVCVPAAEVGGDYYDFFAEEDGGLAVAVADVAGHGLASGLVLATVRSGLALLMEEPGSGDRILRRLDRLVRRGSRRMLVTLTLARFDARRGELTVTSAGHPPMLARRAAGGRVEELGCPAPPLGTHLAPAWPDAVTTFAAGDAFLLFSDGLFEMRDEEGEVYGIERLQRLLAGWNGDGGAAELCAAVIADLEWHRGGAAQEDDLTVVALVAR